MMLKSSDGEAVALHSQTIARMVADNEIPLEGSILTMVIEYCSTHDASDSSSDERKEELKKWDADFMNAMKEQSTLFDVMLAAYYLNIKDLVDLSCQTVADMITGKTPDEIRKLLNIENDFTPEEEEELRKEEKSMGF